jgi:uncharacterized membrane protein
MTNPERSGDGDSSLPSHVETTIRAIADMQALHQQRSTPSQRAFAIIAGVVARPRFIGVVTLAIVLWTSTNLAARQFGFRPWDPPPFNWLQGIVSIAALYTTVIILIAQKREDELSALREQLTLELAILSEQKSAKTIQLLETLRRDMPSAPNRVDLEAEAMAKPTDPMSVADALIERNAAAVLDGLQAPAPDTDAGGG